MLQLSLCYITIVLLLIGSSHGQLDPFLCPNGPSSNIPDPKWSAVPPRFEIVTELVSGNVRHGIVPGIQSGQRRRYLELERW